MKATEMNEAVGGPLGAADRPGTAEALSSRFAEVAGINVHYHDLGAGPVVILLHGSGPGASGWSNYERNAEALAGTFRVIVPDLPGFGKSDMKPVDARMPGWWAELMLGLMDRLDIGTADFVGNSMGGMVALKLALEAPGRAGRLVLMGSGGGLPVFTPFPTEGIKTLVGFYDGPGPSAARLKTFIQQCVFDPAAITDELVQGRLAAALDPRIVARPPMRPGPGGPPEELWRDARLTKLTHETLLIWGREDRVMPLDAGLVLLRQIPRAQLAVIPQCGHWVQWEQAAIFNRMVRSFLQDA